MTDAELLHLALGIAEWSQDPNTRVGAVIVSEGRIISNGFNAFPRGIAHTPERLADRDEKLKRIICAERRAILSAARDGTTTSGGILYLAKTDDSGMTWGGPPCSRCAAEVIECGIVKVVSLPARSTPSKWDEDAVFALEMLGEAGVMYREVGL